MKTIDAGARAGAVARGHRRRQRRAHRACSPRWTRRSAARSATRSRSASRIEVLRGGGPADTRELPVETLARRDARARRRGAEPATRRAAQSASVLADGRALEVFATVVAAQGGDPRGVDEPGAAARAARPGRDELRAARGVGRRDRHRAARPRRPCCSAPGRRTKEDDLDPAAGDSSARVLGEAIRWRARRAAARTALQRRRPARRGACDGRRGRRVRRRRRQRAPRAVPGCIATGSMPAVTARASHARPASSAVAAARGVPARARRRRRRGRRSSSARGSAPTPTSSSDAVARAATREIPHWPASAVVGHAGLLVVGGRGGAPRARDVGPRRTCTRATPPTTSRSAARARRARRAGRHRHQRRRRPQPELGARHADADPRSHRPAAPQPAARPERRAARPAVPRHDRGLRAPAARARRRRRRGPRHRTSSTASTSRCPARPTRRRPRSAPSARSAPTRSACRRCPRRSSRGTWAREVIGISCITNQAAGVVDRPLAARRGDGGGGARPRRLHRAAGGHR